MRRTTKFALMSVVLMSMFTTALVQARSDSRTVSTAMLSGTIWHDQNEDGFFDVGEGGVGGVAIELQNRQREVIRTVTTDSSGNYTVKVKTGEAYFLRMVAPSSAVIGPFRYRQRQGTAQTQNDFERTTGYALEGKDGLPLFVADYGGLGSNDISDIDGGLIMRPDLAVRATASATNGGGIIDITVRNIAPAPILAGHGANDVMVKIAVPLGAFQARLGNGQFIALPSCRDGLCRDLPEQVLVAEQPYTIYEPQTRSLTIGSGLGAPLSTHLAANSEIAIRVEFGLDRQVAHHFEFISEASHNSRSGVAAYDRNYRNNLTAVVFTLK